MIKPQVLIVDDEPEIRRIMSFRFIREGFQTHEAGNAKEAMEILFKNPVKVIVSDIKMPGGDGFELVREVKKIETHRPSVIFVTAHSDFALDEAYALGVEAIFSKPINFDALLELAKGIINRDKNFKRKHPRIEIDFDVSIQINENPLFKADENSFNIGQGGFFVGINENFPKTEDHINFKIQAFSGEALFFIQGKALVRWVRPKPQGDLPCGMGAEFVEMDEASRKNLNRIINIAQTKAFIPKR